MKIPKVKLILSLIISALAVSQGFGQKLWYSDKHFEKVFPKDECCYEKKEKDECCEPCYFGKDACLFGYFTNPNLTINMIATSEDIFRGLLLKHHSFQNIIALEVDNPLLSSVWEPRIYIGSFMNLPLEKKPLEVDYLIGHQISVEPYCGYKFVIDTGYIHYTYPGDYNRVGTNISGKKFNRTNEFYVGLLTDVYGVIKPTLYFYWDINLESFTVETKIKFKKSLDWFYCGLPDDIYFNTLICAGVVQAFDFTSDQRKIGEKKKHNGYSYFMLSPWLSMKLNDCTYIGTGFTYSINNDGVTGNLGGHENIFAVDLVRLQLSY